MGKPVEKTSSGCQNQRENATEKLRKCAEKVTIFDKKQLKSEKFRQKVLKSGAVLGGF
jgi:hypothetical protein